MYHLHPWHPARRRNSINPYMGTCRNRGLRRGGAWVTEGILLDLRTKNECSNCSEQSSGGDVDPMVKEDAVCLELFPGPLLAEHGHRAFSNLPDDNSHVEFIPHCIHLLCPMYTWVNHVQYWSLSKQAHLTSESSGTIPASSSSDNFYSFHLESSCQAAQLCSVWDVKMTLIKGLTHKQYLGFRKHDDL